jgi:hypothetical protein
MITTLARPLFARLVRFPRAWLFAVAWCALSIALAISARARGTPHGADRVLIDAFGAIVLPLLAFGLAGALVGSGSLRTTVAPFAAFGARPVMAAASALLVAVVATTMLGSVLAGVLAIIAHGSGDPPLVRDALASAYAGALGGVAYGALFTMGASLGRRGGGRALLLVVDWLLGLAGGAASLITPRAHLRSLLGGPPPMELPGGVSALALLILAACYGAVTLVRFRR